MVNNPHAAQVAAAIAPLFYDGITEPRQWQAALCALQQAVGGASFHQISLDPGSGQVFDRVVSDLVHDSKAQEYEHEFAAGDERLELLTAMPVGQFMLDHDHFDARQMSRSATYSDFLHSVHMRHTLAIPMGRDDRAHDYLGIMRASSDGAYGEADRALLQRLVPDIARATRLRSHVRTLGRQALLAQAALDQLRQPVALAGADGKVAYLNRQAERLLRASDWIGCRLQRLQLAAPAGQARLQAALANAACAGPGRTASALRVDAGSGRPSSFICVLPLHAGHALAAETGGQPLAMLVFCGPPGSASHGGTPTLMRTLGITPTEAALAQALADGRTVKHFTLAQGCTLNTARGHLKNLLAKTGCRRQVELVQLVQALG